MAQDKKPEATEARAAAAQRPGFTREGKPYPGVDPKTGERRALTLEGAKKEFGPKRGEEVYLEVMRAGGYGEIHPNDLLLDGLSGEHRERVDEILRDAGDYQPGETVTDEARAEGAKKAGGGKG